MSMAGYTLNKSSCRNPANEGIPMRLLKLVIRVATLPGAELYAT